MRDRFMQKVRQEPSGCWSWTGALLSNGYGRFKTNGEMINAHRVAYTLFTGPIPDGLEIDHLCRNPSCVNPAHLEAVTKTVNILRGESPPALNARATHCKSGHAFTAENTYTRPDGARSCRACNREAVHRYTTLSKQEAPA